MNLPSDFFIPIFLDFEGPESSFELIILIAKFFIVQFRQNSYD